MAAVLIGKITTVFHLGELNIGGVVAFSYIELDGFLCSQEIINSVQGGCPNNAKHLTVFSECFGKVKLSNDVSNLQFCFRTDICISFSKQKDKKGIAHLDPS